jgi:hypothetical protein
VYPDDPQMKILNEHYDSAWHPTGTVKRVEEGKEENCVKDLWRILVVVHPTSGVSDAFLITYFERDIKSILSPLIDVDVYLHQNKKGRNPRVKSVTLRLTFNHFFLGPYK